MTQFEETGISPISYMKIFFRRKELIIVPVIAGLVLGICAGMLIPREYKSETVILVQEGKTDNPLFERLAVSTTVRQRMAGIRESILGWNSLIELVKRLNLDKDVRTKMDFERLIMRLRSNIIIRLRGENIIHLAYVGENPEMTQSIVKNITDIFVERNVHLQDQETADAIKFIEEQLKVYKGKIKSAEIAQSQERLDALLLDATEKHPLVKELRELIASKKEELRKENLEFTENVNLSAPVANPIVNEIKKALDGLEGKPVSTSDDSNDFSKVMMVANLATVMGRDVAVNEGIYNMLLQRLETAKITQRLQSSKEGTRYTVLDPPRIPLSPFKPNRVLVSLIGLFLGLMGGVGLVVAAEFLDKSFIDVEEAKNYLGVPLLGAISKINTIESIMKEKERERWVYMVTLIVGVFLIILTFAFSKLIK